LRFLFNKLDRIKEGHFGLLLLSPAMLIVMALGGFPILYSLYLSFTKYILSHPRGPEFVGLANYVALLHNPAFLNSLWKTAYFSAILIIGSTTLGLSLAIALNRNFKGKALYITLLLIPWAIPKVVNGLIWKWIFDGNYGILNAVLLKLGIIDHYIFWFGESPIIGILLIGLASVWKNVPFVTIFYLAALQTLPHDLYDAATVDGANALQQFLYVTVPQLRHTFVIVFILQTTWAVKLFDLIQVLTKGGPGDKTMVAYYYVYRQAFSYLNIGYGAAGAYIITLIIILFIVLYYKSFKMGAVG